MPILDPAFLSFLPTIPIPFRPSTGAEKGQPSECWLKDTETKEEFRFAFNPSVTFERSHDFQYHKGILNDEAIPIPVATGVKTYRFEHMIYKLDRDYNLMQVTENLRQLAAMKDGKLKIVKFKSKAMIIKCYIRDISIRWNDDYAENKIPRQAEVSFTLVPYKALPVPKDGGAPDTQSGFYTIKSDAVPKAKSTNTRGGSTAIWQKILKTRQTEGGGPPPEVDVDPGIPGSGAGD